MIRRLSIALGKLVLTLAGMALITAAALFVLAAFLTTWPILRLSPRERHLKATLDAAAAGAQLLAAFKGEQLLEDLAGAAAASSSSDETGA